ncbi:MAG: acetyl-CoA carboxylase biotin carboxyl carrier protein, partial [Alphaproteobacteria bacterium]
MARSPKATDIDADAVRKLASLLEETGLTEIEYTHDDWSLRVSKGATAVTATAPVAIAPAADAPAAEQGVPAG